MPELCLLDRDDLASMALGAAMLPHHPADKALRSFPRRDPTASPGLRLEHQLLQLRFCQKPFEPGVLLCQLSHPPGFLGLHAAVLLPPAVVGRLRHLDDATDLDDGLALGDQLLRGFQFADDLLRRVPGAFHGEVPSPAWPDEDSHSP